MFSEDNESQLFKAIKGLLYAFMIGALYYSGGFGWALFFTRKEGKRELMGKYNLLFFVFEALILIGLFILDVFRDFPFFMPVIGYKFFSFMILHAAISFIGSLFYITWYLISLFIPKKEISTFDEKNYEESHEDSMKKLYEIQENVNSISWDSDKYWETKNFEYEQRKENNRLRDVQRLYDFIKQHIEYIKISEQEYRNIQNLSSLELTEFFISLSDNMLENAKHDRKQNNNHLNL